MITITFQAKNQADLKEQLHDWLGLDQPESLRGPVMETPKRGPGRPKKVDKIEEPIDLVQPEVLCAPMDMKAEVPIPAPVPASPTIEDIKHAVRAVTTFRPGKDKDTHDSIRRGVELLRAHGATTIKELKPEQYAAFLIACQTA